MRRQAAFFSAPRACATLQGMHGSHQSGPQSLPDRKACLPAHIPVGQKSHTGPKACAVGP
eukprot:342730-Pyramimonas_sp.AAC.1